MQYSSPDSLESNLRQAVGLAACWFMLLSHANGIKWRCPLYTLTPMHSSLCATVFFGSFLPQQRMEYNGPLRLTWTSRRRHNIAKAQSTFSTASQFRLGGLRAEALANVQWIVDSPKPQFSFRRLFGDKKLCTSILTPNSKSLGGIIYMASKHPKDILKIRESCIISYHESWIFINHIIPTL